MKLKEKKMKEKNILDFNKIGYQLINNEIKPILNEFNCIIKKIECKYEMLIIIQIKYEKSIWEKLEIKLEAINKKDDGLSYVGATSFCNGFSTIDFNYHLINDLSC